MSAGSSPQNFIIEILSYRSSTTSGWVISRESRMFEEKEEDKQCRLEWEVFRSRWVDVTDLLVNTVNPDPSTASLIR